MAERWTQADIYFMNMAFEFVEAEKEKLSELNVPIKAPSNVENLIQYCKEEFHFKFREFTEDAMTTKRSQNTKYGFETTLEDLGEELGGIYWANQFREDAKTLLNRARIEVGLTFDTPNKWKLTEIHILKTANELVEAEEKKRNLTTSLWERARNAIGLMEWCKENGMPGPGMRDLTQSSVRSKAKELENPKREVTLKGLVSELLHHEKKLVNEDTAKHWCEQVENHLKRARIAVGLSFDSQPELTETSPGTNQPFQGFPLPPGPEQFPIWEKDGTRHYSNAKTEFGESGVKKSFTTWAKPYFPTRYPELKEPKAG